MPKEDQTPEEQAIESLGNAGLSPEKAAVVLHKTLERYQKSETIPEGTRAEIEAVIAQVSKMSISEAGKSGLFDLTVAKIMLDQGLTREVAEQIAGRNLRQMSDSEDDESGQ